MACRLRITNQQTLLQQLTCVCMIRRHKKLYASLHNQERKAFIFPNTPGPSVLLPQGIQVCKSLNEFKIKNLKGGFQRRPELICQRVSSTGCQSQGSGSNLARNSKVERIQHELVTASLKLLHTVRFVDKVTTVSKYPPFLFQELYIQASEGAQYDAPKTLPLTVDIGCGGGYSLKPLIAMGYPCIGVDLDLSSLQQTKIDLLSPKFRNHLRSKAISVNIQPDLDTISMSPVRNKLNALSSAADVVRWDLRRGLPFKQNSFDLAISISFLQWLFYGNPKDQLDRFFATLKSVLCPNGRAILQFYPQNRKQLEEAVERAVPYFRGVVLGDYPHLDRGRKLFLILFPFHPQEV